jgi:hypothetical protein
LRKGGSSTEKKALLIAATIALVAIAVTAWMCRYDLVQGSQRHPVVYRLDRWTGDLTFVYVDEAKPVKAAPGEIDFSDIIPDRRKEE